MKMFLAILVCKLGRFVGRLIGKGSSMPGKFALKICPDILRRVQMPDHIIAVTGSNGKTSTVEMIAAILRSDGRKVVYNEEGSNQIEGVTTLVLTNATFGGRVKAEGPPDEVYPCLRDCFGVEVCRIPSPEGVFYSFSPKRDG